MFDLETDVVARAGVQPATFALGVRCSMHLSYRAILGSVFAGLCILQIRRALSPGRDGWMLVRRVREDSAAAELASSKQRTKR
jgi:hypothetical protein